MFRLRFFGGFVRQRRAFLAADEFVPLPLHGAVEEQLTHLDVRRGVELPPAATPVTLYLSCLNAVRPLVIASIGWNIVSVFVVLAGVLAAREVMALSSSLLAAAGLCVVYGAARLGEAAIEYADWLRRGRQSRGMQAHLFSIVNRAVTNLDPAHAGEFTGGQLKTLIGSDVEGIEDFLHASIWQWVPTTVAILILGPALYVMAGALGLVALGLALLALPVAMLGAGVMRHFQMRAQREQDHLTSIIGEWVRNIRLVRYLGWERAVEEEIAGQMRRFSLLHACRHATACVLYGLTWSWWMVPVLGMFAAAAWLDLEVTLPGLFASLWILEHLMNYIQHLPYSISLYGNAAAGAERILRLTRSPQLTRAIEPAPVAAVAPGDRPVRLHLVGVELRYGEAVAIRGITTTIDLTTRTAIVGRVGSGKSTLLELLIGERIPTGGSVEVEFASGARGPLWRRDIYEALRCSVAWSPQRPFLSNATMRANIDLSGEASTAAVERAAVRARLGPDIALFPRGYAEEVGETGINLSGGQKQRVSIARALLEERPVLVLDDPLSAVDPTTEVELMEEILASSGGLILVSHRLSELCRCDRVIVLEAGQVVEDGQPVLLGGEPRSRFSAFLRAVEEHHGG